MIPVETYFKIWGARNGMSFAATAHRSRSPGAGAGRSAHAAALLPPSRPKEDDTFRMLTSDALLNFWNQLTGAIAATAVGVVSVFMVVGGVVIMNIMLAVVTERTHEIGIRKSVGARRRDILNQFLVESSVLSAIGGLIGVIDRLDGRGAGAQLDAGADVGAGDGGDHRRDAVGGRGTVLRHLSGAARRASWIRSKR